MKVKTPKAVPKGKNMHRKPATISEKSRFTRRWMKRPEIADQIERNHALARDLGIRGTPAFVIGTDIVPGAIDLDTMRSLVAKARRG